MSSLIKDLIEETYSFACNDTWSVFTTVFIFLMLGYNLFSAIGITVCAVFGSVVLANIFYKIKSVLKGGNKDVQ